ncbi:DegT/DnrJ/EryC1/StrS family aminotransferase [Streptomyces sp. NPDC059866]|uniref:DegT/DnrJ/EryC1/StrS family aminotransferase n=1 Tax=unclassified Streptomyces TaxID=2593676 RepID=UPI00101E569D|nr:MULTISPECIES: DegT/DnrJ/EryC1/StrS family aminotransferase [unclassified Streptomyces]MBZ9638897.1 DegT/DnrJ/EryC1/StrS family aminotransferase [Streptomyces sp. PSKA30]RZB16731.1 dTDP-4-dehydro-6-deoxyglucose aminotransferase [Streptomyces sp. F001]
MRAKRSRSDLAYYGGTPGFAEDIRVGTPNVPAKERYLELVNEAIDRRWLSNLGPLVRQFEGLAAQRTLRAHNTATNNATTALQVAVKACGVTGEVIMPSFTFVATAHAMNWIGLTPVFADVDPETGTLDPRSVAKAVSPRTGGILGVHIWGNLCDTAGLDDVAREAGVPLVFDSAQSFGCRPLLPGPSGTAEVFSFHATKILNCFEGGLVATDSADVHARVRSMHNFGFDEAMNVVGPGTNAKMNESSAAMGIASIEHLDDMLKIYRAHYLRYREGLAAVPGVTLMAAPDGQTHNHQYVVVQVDPEAAGLDRDRLADMLGAENIRTKKYFSPGCHRMRPYRQDAVHTPVDLSVTEALTERVLALPTGLSVTPDDVDRISDVIAAAVRYA